METCPTPILPVSLGFHDSWREFSINTILFWIPEAQLIQCCVDLVMGGSDTTSNTLEFALLAMIRNPEVQAKVQEEIDSVIGQTRLPTLADRAQ